MERNEPKDQDRVADLFDHFSEFGYCMFPQQKKIYDNIARSDEIAYSRVLEVGCGVGTGTATIHETATQLNNKVEIIGTDKINRNIRFAREIYPWIQFAAWDVEKPFPVEYLIAAGLDPVVDEIVCVEVLEHLGQPLLALHNMMGHARCGIWLSTPNGAYKPRPPENPYHVLEYTPNEIIEMVERVNDSFHINWEVIIYHWETMEVLERNTDVSPLLYRIQK